jgi:Bifunctional DNA primase/polymerase, N-terminal
VKRRNPGTKAGATSTTPIADAESSGPLRIPEMPPGVDTLTGALAYAAAGLYVLPVRRGTKDPGSVVGKRWQVKSSCDPKVITAWFAGTNHGIALHCGRSGLVVFDVDNPDKLPEILRKHLQHAPFQSTRPDIPGIRGLSVGIRPTQVHGRNIMAADLVEISLVARPSNPLTLVEACALRAKAIRESVCGISIRSSESEQRYDNYRYRTAQPAGGRYPQPHRHGHG